MIRINCPGCKAGLRITDDLAGTDGKCPGCGKGFTVPDAEQTTETNTDSLPEPEPRPRPAATTTEQSFDPMDVLNAAVEPVTPKAASIASVSGNQALADKNLSEPKGVRPRAEPEPTAQNAASADPDSAAAAAAVAMQRDPTRLAPKPAAPAERHTLKDEIKEKFASREQVIETVREQPLFLVLAGLILVAGFMFMPTSCDDGRVPVYPVTGRVLFKDGSPVRTGTIELRSEVGTTANGSIGEDGRFVLGTYAKDDGAAAGFHKAIVRQMVINDGTTQHTKDHGLPVAIFHSRYETSGLRLEVSAENPNDLRVEVSPQPRPQNQNE